MRYRKKTAVGAACGAVILIAVLLFLAVASGKLSLPVSKKERFIYTDSDAPFAQELRVNGNHLENEAGETVVLQGIMVPELKKLASEKKFNEEYFKEVFAFGGNVIRIPVHPDAWEQDEYYLWRYLDPAVEWAVRNGSYVILDMHCIGNIDTGAGEQMPSSDAREYASAFWALAADYFRDVPNVLFEIYNEPAQIDAASWAERAADLVRVIRDTGSRQVVIVSSTDYTYNLNMWRDRPLEDDQVLYSAHIFPNRQGSSMLSQNAEKLPVIVTEWGYIAKDEPASQRYLIGSEELYAAPMLKLMNEKNVSWVACWYDDGWEPPMLGKDGAGLTEWGAFVRDALR